MNATINNALLIHQKTIVAFFDKDINGYQGKIGNTKLGSIKITDVENGRAQSLSAIIETDIAIPDLMGLAVVFN